MSSHQLRGLMIAAPSSGSGKTVLTLALLRALKNQGIDISGAKAGPDYIDPQFHHIATGRKAYNLDPWSMDGDQLSSLLHAYPSDHVLVEGMMGLYDGAADGTASSAELAKTLKLPVLLVVNAAKQSHSIAALVHGFSSFDGDVKIAGVLLNAVGSERHEAMLREAIAPLGLPVVGAIPRSDGLALPERHLGLVQAHEQDGIEAFVEGAANVISKHCDLAEIAGLFERVTSPEGSSSSASLPPLGQRIAVAKDAAFAFSYPHVLDGWKNQGAEISFFSPLLDEEAPADCDAVYLPGGYPELHAEVLANAQAFKSSLLSAKDRGALIYGECGGYMVLGEGLTDEKGATHQMAGLLKLETSFAKRKLHLGYRRIEANGFALGTHLRGHEFHYTCAIKEQGEPLFQLFDARGADLGSAGLREGTVMGSYVHVISQVRA